MSQKKQNPSEFGYIGNEKIEITSTEFTSIVQMVDYFLNKETEKKIPYKFKHINAETGLEIGKITDKNRHQALKIVDIDKTLNSQEVVSLSKDGLELLKLKMQLESIHLENIESGVAKHSDVLRAFFEKSTAPVEQTSENEAPEESEEVK